MLIGVSIIGVIAGMGVTRFSAFQKSKQLDEEARALVAAVAHGRSLVLKKDRPHLIALDKDGGGYALYEDLDADRIADPGERVSGHRLPANVAFGAPGLGSAKGPNGSGTPSLKAEGGWTANLYLDSDRTATLNDGSFYLSVPGTKNRAVCIRKTPGTRQAVMWRWDGSRWISL